MLQYFGPSSDGCDHAFSEHATVIVALGKVETWAIAFAVLKLMMVWTHRLKDISSTIVTTLQCLEEILIPAAIAIQCMIGDSGIQHFLFGHLVLLVETWVSRVLQCMTCTGLEVPGSLHFTMKSLQTKKRMNEIADNTTYNQRNNCNVLPRRSAMTSASASWEQDTPTSQATVCSDGCDTETETFKQLSRLQFHSRMRYWKENCSSSPDREDPTTYRCDNSDPLAAPQTFLSSADRQRDNLRPFEELLTDSITRDRLRLRSTVEADSAFVFNSYQPDSSGYSSGCTENYWQRQVRPPSSENSSAAGSLVASNAVKASTAAVLTRRSKDLNSPNVPQYQAALVADTIAATGSAVVQVLSIGSSQSLNDILQQSLNIEPPKPQQSFSYSSAHFPIRMSQLVGSKVNNRNIDWYSSVSDPMLDIPQCSGFLGNTHTPLLLVVSANFLCSENNFPEILKETVRDLTLNQQQPQLHVIITDEIENETDEQRDATPPTHALERMLQKYPYKLWYWKSSQKHFSLTPDGELSFAMALEKAAIKQASAIRVTPQLISIEQEVLGKRHHGVRVLAIKEFTGLLTGHAHDRTPLLSKLSHLERKGLVLGRSLAKWTTISSADSGAEEVSYGHTLNSLPEFLILDPIWFYNKASRFVKVVIDRQSEEDSTLLPSACHRGFYHKQTLKIVDDVLPDSSLTEKEAFEACLKHDIVINVSDILCGCNDSDSSVYVTGSDTKHSNAPNYRDFLFIPGTLLDETLPRLGGQAVFPMALRSPGIQRKSVPITFFYDVVALLTKHFPLAVKCTRHEARFNVDPNHVLQLLYSDEYGCINVTMLVFTKDPTFASTTTATVCSTVRKTVSSYVKKVSPRYETGELQFAAVIKADSETGQSVVDFVDLGDTDVMHVDQLYSIGNHPFHPPSNFYLWYDSLGKATRIRERFTQVLSQINEASVDIAQTAVWLFQRYQLDQIELIEMLRTDPAARGGLLLLFLEKRGSLGGSLLDHILQNPELIKQQDPQDEVRNTASSNPPSSVEDHGTSLQTNRQQDRTARSLTLSSDVESDSVKLDNGSDRVSDVTPVSVRESRHTSRDAPISTNEQISHANDVVARGGLNSKFGNDSTVSTRSLLPFSPSRREVTEADGTASAGVHDHSMSQTNHYTIPGKPSFDRNSVAVPSSRSFVDMERSSIAIPPQHTGISHIPQEVPRNPEMPQSPVDALRHVDDEPPVHPIFEAKYLHVQKATNNFDPKPMKDNGKRLGSGTFGTVYYGVLHSEAADKFEVAIKRLKKASSLNPEQIEVSRKQFATEMNILTRYIHANIVKLLGFSSDGPELCLLYEYMARGALSHRLDCKDNSPPIEWRYRLTIARDIGVALEFLHTRYQLPVIHRDVKSSNVLLGPELQAKLSDFGLAVVGETSAEHKAHRSGGYVGTRPYMPPEVFTGVISPKGDVYGLGMILYELATGLPPYSSKKKQDLKEYIDFIEEQGVDMMKMLDPKARWPKGRGSFGSQKFGLDLLNAAKFATTKEYALRPEITELLDRLRPLADKVETRS